MEHGNGIPTAGLPGSSIPCNFGLRGEGESQEKGSTAHVVDRETQMKTVNQQDWEIIQKDIAIDSSYFRGM